MIALRKPLALIILLGLAGAVVAQETTPDPAAPAASDAPASDAPATATSDPAANGLALGQEVDPNGIGSTYVKEAFVDWDLTCIRTVASTNSDADPCQLYQLLRDGDGNDVAEVSLFPLPAGQQAVAGATVVTPLETLLTEDLVIQVDQGSAKRYPFSFCTTGGCIARVGFTAEELAALKAGIKANLTIVPVAAPDQKVVLNLSLKGFTAGFEAVSKALAK